MNNALDDVGESPWGDVRHPLKGQIMRILASLIGGADGGLGGKLGACLGIDIQAADGAPAGEIIRIDLDQQHPEAGALDTLYNALGSLAPLVVGQGESVLVRHDRAARSISLSRIPSEADAAGAGHGDVPPSPSDWDLEAIFSLAKGKVQSVTCTTRFKDRERRVEVTFAPEDGRE